MDREEEGGDVAIECDVHLYGEIAPIDLVAASFTHTNSSKVLRDRVAEAEWQRILECYDEDDLPEYYGPDRYAISVLSLTLHEHARLLTTDAHPVNFLSNKRDDADSFDWSFDLRDCNAEYMTPRELDIRHLRKDTIGLEETLQACVWLLQKDVCYQWEANVICYSDMVLPLYRTVGVRWCIIIHAHEG
jgi:hypothetical protein